MHTTDLYHVARSLAKDSLAPLRSAQIAPTTFSVP